MTGNKMKTRVELNDYEMQVLKKSLQALQFLATSSPITTTKEKDECKKAVHRLQEKIGRAERSQNPIVESVILQ